MPIPDHLLEAAAAITGVDLDAITEAANWTEDCMANMEQMAELTRPEAQAILIAWIDHQVALNIKPRKMSAEEVLAWHLTR
jgi:hypothetical protein